MSRNARNCSSRCCRFPRVWSAGFWDAPSYGAYARTVRRIPARGQGGIQPGAHHGGESSLCPAAPADVNYTAICSAYNAKCGTRLAARWMPNWSAILSGAPLASGSRGDSSGVDLTGQAKRQAAKRRQSAGAKSLLAVGRTTRMLLDVTIGPKGIHGRLIRTDSMPPRVTGHLWHERPQARAVRLHAGRHSLGQAVFAAHGRGRPLVARACEHGR